VIPVVILGKCPGGKGVDGEAGRSYSTSVVLRMICAWAG
jgi:hypothetical protein